MAKKAKEKFKTNKSFDFILFITILLLLTLGIIMVLSASSPSSLALTGRSYTYVEKQLLSAIIGIVLMIGISFIDYRIYKKFHFWIYAISVGVLLLVVVPGIGREVNGARRWINVPIFKSMQPSEITKLGLIVFFSAYLSMTKDDLKSLWKGFIRPILFFLAPPVLILFFVQSHLSALIVIVLVTAVIMLVARK